jgi:hypothetical protein
MYRTHDKPHTQRTLFHFANLHMRAYVYKVLGMHVNMAQRNSWYIMMCTAGCVWFYTMSCNLLSWWEICQWFLAHYISYFNCYSIDTVYDVGRDIILKSLFQWAFPSVCNIINNFGVKVFKIYFLVKKNCCVDINLLSKTILH